MQTLPLTQQRSDSRKLSNTFQFEFCAYLKTFVWIFLLASGMAPVLASAQNYNIKDLGALLGTNSYAHGINNQGQVVGYWTSTNGARAFLYDDGVITDLGSLGGTNNYALSINSSGQVVGFADDTNGVSAFLFSNGAITNLGSLGGQNSYAYGINDGGNVVGYLDTVDGTRAFLYFNNSVTNLGTLGGTNSFAFGINNSNLVVGSSLTEVEATHAFLWQNGVLTNLNELVTGTSGWVLNDARGINNAGKIVGWGRTNNQEQAFLFADGVINGIGILPGGTNSFAYGINNSNRVVGASATTNGLSQAFVWVNNSMTNLNELLPQGSGWVLREARGINDSGSIVGWGVINGEEHAFILSSNAPPSVVLTSPTNNVLLVGPTTMSLDASANDADGSIAKVEFYNETTKLGEDLAEPFQLVMENVSEGSFELTAVAVDDSGARSTSSVVNATIALPPVIAIQPVSQHILTGSNVTFTVTTSGSIPLSYQWRFNGDTIPGATEGSYSITNVQTIHMGNYSVQVTNLVGTATSSNAKLTVTVDPFNMGKGDWIYFLSMATNQLGGNVPSVVDIATLMNYERQKGMQFVVVKAGDGTTIWNQFNSELIDAAHAAGLKIFGYARAYGTNTAGEVAVATNALALGADGFVIDAEMEYESHYHPNNNAAAEAYLQGIRAVYPNAFLAHAPFALISLHSTFPYVTFGKYCDVVMPQCYWKNFGMSAASMVSQLDSEWHAWQNSLVGSDTNAIKPIVPIAQAWSPSSSSIVTGAELAEFVNRLKTNSNPASIGGYKGVSFWRADLHSPDMWNGIGGASIGNPTGAPLILTQPQSYVVDAGDTATFTVEATGSAPLGYQWRRNGNNIVGATSTSHTRNNIQSIDVGVYSVIVSNAAGTVVSSDALLSMESHSLLFEDFEAGLNNWTTISSALTNSSLQNHTLNGTNAAKVGSSANRMYRNIGTEIDGYSKVTFWIYDGTQTRAYGEVRAYSGAGYGQGSLQQIFAIGRYSANFGTGVGSLAGEVVDTTKYQGRVFAGSNNGWFNLNAIGVPGRSTGWHKFEIERLANGTTVNFYVDGVLGRTISAASGARWDSVSIGSVAAGTTSGDAWFDDIDVQYFGIPTILTQPTNVTVNSGATVTFSVLATNNVTGYQWRKNGVNIAGATSSTLILSNVNGSHAGEYTVVVANDVGSVISAIALLTVIEPPVFVTPPANQYADIGSEVTFQAVVSGTPPFSYVWKKNGTILLDGGNITGSDSDHLIISNLTEQDAAEYSVTVSNSAGSVAASAVLSVNRGLIFFEDFETGTLNNWTNVSGATSLMISGTRNNPVSGSKTAWQTNSLNKMYHNLGVEVQGSASITIWIYDAGSEQERAIGEVRSYSGNGFGQGSLQQILAIGNYRTLFDSNTGNLQNEQVQTNYYQGRVFAGQNTGWFNLNASGISERSVGWHKFHIEKSTDGSTIKFYVDGKLGRTITGVANASLDTVAIGSYGAGVGDSELGWFDDIKIEYLAPGILSQPVSLTKVAGQSASFSVGAGGHNLAYQWQKNGSNIPGATTATLTISSVQPTDEGAYAVLISNSQGTLSSDAATLTVIVSPSITTHPVDQVVTNGSVVAFTVEATGSNLSYQWRKNGTNLSNGPNISGANSPILSLSNVSSQDQGVYTVLVSNAAGSVTSSTATLTVGTPLIITEQPATQTVISGDNAVFSVTAEGSSPLTYQWRLNGDAISGATVSVYTKESVQLSDAGNYSVVVNDSVGQITSDDAVLTVIIPPSITGQPISQVVPEGTNVTLSVTTSGTAPMAYQWRVNGNIIPGATQSTLIKSNVQSEDSGGYSVQVSNAAGNAISSTANLTVSRLSRIVIFGSNPENEGPTTLCVGSSVILKALPEPFGVSFPVDYPHWTVSSQPSGSAISNLAPGLDTVEIVPAIPGQYVIQANCGTSVDEFVITVLDSGDPDYNGIGGCQEVIDGSEVDLQLSAWFFDSLDFAGWQGNSPLLSTNVSSVGGWSILGVQVNSNHGPAYLVYREIETNASIANINLRAGSVRFWYRPDWNSASTNNGTGPQTEARLVDVGEKGTTNGWWGLTLNNDGTGIRFGTQTNTLSSLQTNVSASIQWTSNDWHQIVLTYSPTSSVLYIDGGLAAVGSGVSNWPAASVRAEGFRIGSDKNGVNWAQGRFDNLQTFNHPLSTHAVTNYYKKHPRPLATNNCLLAPIALYVTNVISLSPGSIAYSTNGIGPGNFGWLDWNGGSSSAPELGEALTNWTKSFTFVNARDSSDFTLSVDDWIYGNSGVSSSVSPSLNWLTNTQTNFSIVLWSESSADSNGNNSKYKAAQYAQIRLLDYSLSGSEKWFKYQYLGPVGCDSISNQPPTISIISPTNYQIFNIPASIEIVALASDPEDALTRVSFYSGETLLGEVPYSVGSVDLTNNIHKLTWPGITDSGIYQIRAVATDALNLSSTSQVVNVIVNASPQVSAGPDQTVILPVGATSTNIALLGNAWDDGLPNPVLTTTWTVLSSNGPVTFSNAGLTNTTATFTTNGTYVFRLTVNDGAVSVSSDCTITVMRPPYISIEWPINNSTFSAGITLTNVALAYDLDGIVTNVQFFAGTNLLGTAIPGDNDTFSFRWPVIPMGSYVLTAVAKDNDGLISTSAPINVLVSSVLAVHITHPVPDSIFVAPATLPITAVVASSVDVDRVEFFANGNLIGTDAISSENPYTFIWAGVPASGSNYNLTARVVDGLSNSTTSSIVPIRVVPPIVVDAGTNRTILLTNTSATLTLDGSITGGAGNETVLWTQIVGPASAEISAPAMKNSDITFTGKTGNYLLRMSATDGYSTAADTVMISVLTNRPPVVDAGPNRFVTPGSSAFLNGSVSDDGLPQPSSISNWWTVVNAPVGGVTFTNANTPVTVANNLTVAGIYTLRLHATDGLATVHDEMTITVTPSTSRTYTLNADFAEGATLNVNYDEAPHQLQLNYKVTPFPYVWVACSARNTVVRIDANTGQILGEFRTAPETNLRNPDPSRTTVDKHGNVWVGNRYDHVEVDGATRGSVARIALVIGGTRGYKTNDLGGTNFTFVASQDGQWLKPPFWYSTAIDRDGDGLIKTSSGLGNVLGWGGGNTGNDLGGVSLAEDECIINFTRVNSYVVRMIAIDANNDLWVGGTGNRVHEKISGITGEVVSNTAFQAVQGGYGGLIDGNGILWSASGLMRFDINRRFDMLVTPPSIIDNNYFGDAIPASSYGIGIDPTTGEIWCSHGATSPVRISPDGSKIDYFYNPAGSGHGGIAVDLQNNVWIASHGGGNLVAHFKTDGTFVGNLDLGCAPNGGNHGPTGVAVDANGKIWAANKDSGTVMRIDPNRGLRMINGVPNPYGSPLGEVDLTVNLNGPGQAHAGAYNYSDMTGFISLGATEPSGIWQVVHDSGVTNQPWGVVQWTGSEPAGTRIKVEVRAADDVSQLTATNNPFREVDNGVPFEGTVGRHIEIRTTFSHKAGTNSTPVLYDLTVSSGLPVVIANSAKLAYDDSAAVFENSANNKIDVLKNDDVPSGSTLQITSVSSPRSGYVLNQGTNLLYTPSTNFFGIDRFIYTTTDGYGGVSRGIVTVSVGRVVPLPATNLYSAPIARDDTNIVINGISWDQLIPVMANDEDTNTPPLGFSIVSVTQPLHGTARIGGCGIYYTPNVGYFGVDEFSYTIRNAQGISDSAQVKLTVVGEPVQIACGTTNFAQLSTTNSVIPLKDRSHFAHLYTFIGDPNQSVSIGLNDYSDAYLALYDETGVEVATGGYYEPIIYVPRTTNVYMLQVSASVSHGYPLDYSFWMECSTAQVPRISVLLDGTPIGNGGGINFGVTRVGTPVPANLTITNFGTIGLTVHWAAFEPNDGQFELSGSSLPSSITVPAGSSSNLTVNFRALQQGEFTNHLFKIQSTDVEFPSYAIKLHARANPTNAIPPTIAITNPLPNAVFQGKDVWSWPGISITAMTAPAPGASIWGVNFYARTSNGSNIPIGQRLSPDWDNTNKFTFDWTGVPPGIFELTAVAIDNSNLQTVSQPVSVNVVQRLAGSPELKVLFFGTNDLPNDSTINFGVFPPNVAASVNLVITNAGNSALTSTLSTSSPEYYFTNSPVGQFTLQPHGSTNATLVFKTGSYGMFNDRFAYFDSNDPGLYSPFNGNQSVGRLRLQLSAIATNTAIAPTVGLVSPAANAQLIAPASIVLKASVTNHSGGAISRVDFYSGNVYVGSAYGLQSSGLYEYTWNNVPVGNYDLSAVVVDQNGLASLSSTVPITVIVRPANSPILRVFLSQTNELSNGSTIDYGIRQLGSTINALLTLSNSSSVGLTITNLSATGDYTLINTPATPISILAGQSTNITLRYNASWEGQSDGLLTINNGDLALNPFTITTIGRANPLNANPPTITITNPVGGATYVASETYSSSPISITATAAAAGGATISYVEFFATSTNGTIIPIGYVYSPAYTVDWWYAEPGQYQVKAIAVDSTGAKTISAPVAITVLSRSSNSPQLKVLFFGTNELANGSTINFGVVPTNTSVAVDLTITNAGPGILTNDAPYIWNHQFTIIAGPQGPFTLAPQTSTNITVSFRSQEKGQISGGFQLSCNDDGIYDSVYGYGIGVYQLYLKGIATNIGVLPTITITNPVQGSTVLMPTEITINASVTASLTEPLSHIQYYAKSATTNILLCSGCWTSYTWQNPPPGQYDLIAVAVDSIGRAVSSSPVAITVLDRPVISPIMRMFLFATNDLSNLSTIDFGITQVGTPVVAPLTISNAGNANLNVSKFFCPSNVFTISSSLELPITLPPGTSTNLEVVYLANTPGETNGVFTIYNNDVASHPFSITNIGRANRANSAAPTVQLTAPANGSRFAFPADLLVSATANSASNSTLVAVNFFATGAGGTVQIGQLLPAPNQTNMSGTITWSRPAPGVYSLKAIAVDQSGLMGESAGLVQIEIKDGTVDGNNAPPVARDDVLLVQGVLSGTPSPTYSINVLANDTDPNLDPLLVTSFSYSGQLGRMTQEGNRLLFTPNPAWAGTNYAFYTISDNKGGIDGAWVQIVVSWPNLPSVDLISPITGEYIELPIDPSERVLTLKASAESRNPGGSIKKVSFYDQDQLLGIVTNGVANVYSFQWRLPSAGDHLISAIALDEVGQENLSQVAYIYIEGKPNNTLPIANITNLVANLDDLDMEVYPTVTDGKIDLRGVANDSDNEDAVSYQILLYKADGTFVRNLTPNREQNGFYIGTDQNGILATNVDLTMFENGVYDLVLNVFDGWEYSTDTARFLLNSQLKVGQFSFTVQDITLPVGGMPLTVTRTYNSFNLRSGDFGYSWTYALSDVNLELDEVREEASDFISGDRFSLRVGGGRNVTLTLPDGRRVTFQFYFDGPHTCGFGWDPYCYDAKWEAPPGVNATLRAIGAPYFNALTGNWNNSAGIGFENFDFKGFILETADGTQYIIQRDFEGEHFVFSGYNDDYFVETYGQPRLTEIILRDGNRITLDGNTIQHIDPTGTPTRSLTIERDDQGRIKDIFDPNSGNEGLPTLRYIYDDPIGNLSQVQKLVDRTTGAYESTYYQYTNTHFPHFLTGIVDPRGVQAAKTYYYDDGRIWKIEDADGKVTEFLHDFDNRTEITIDRSGNTNSYVYDLKGNVIWITNAMQQVTRLAYDDPSHPSLTTAQTNSYGTLWATWTLHAYDSRGNRTNVTTSSSLTNSFFFSDDDYLLKHVDSEGITTINNYDASRKLTNRVVLDANGQIVELSSFIYDRERLSETRNASNQLLSGFYYDYLGNLTNTVDANGQNRSFSYDANGNQTGSSYIWIDPSGTAHTVTTITEYDSAGRVIKNIDANGNTNLTFYGTGGNIEFSVDKFGNTNRFLYDARGNLIQTTFSDGIYTRTVYDVESRPILTTDRNGITGNRQDYDRVGRLTNSVRLVNVRIDIVSDSLNPGHSKSVIGSVGTIISSSSTEFDDAGRVKIRTGSNGQKTNYDYWPDGQLKSISDPLTNITFFEYNEKGQKKLVIDPLNRTNRFEYDALGRVVKTIFPNDTFTTNIFNTLGQRVGQKDQAGSLTQFSYNTAGKLTNVVKSPVFDPESGLTTSPDWSYVYDQYGRLTVTIDPKGRSTTNTYDANGRQVALSLPMGQTSSNLYSSKGLLLQTIDFEGQKTEYIYDGFGRTKAKFRFDSGAIAPSNAVCYQYNNLGQLWKIVERYGDDAHTNSCDGYAALVGPVSGARAVSSPQVIKAAHWIVSPVLAVVMFGVLFMLVPGVDAGRRAMIEFYFRGGWRLNGIGGQQPIRKWSLPSLFWRFVTVATLAAVLASDPAIQRLSAIEDACDYPINPSTETTRVTEFTYDLDGRVSRVNSPEGVINYGYDLATGRLTRTCTKNSEIEYGYDELGRLKTVSLLKRSGTVLPVPEITTYTYSKVGLRESISLPNGALTFYEYDSLNRLTNLTQEIGTTNLAVYSYQLHETGRRTNAIEILRQEDGGYLTNTLSWQYDGMYRLTNEIAISSASAGTYTNSYTYDLVGNRLKTRKTLGGTTTTTTNLYNANDQLLQEVVEINGAFTRTNYYGYDRNGSMIGKTNVISGGNVETHYGYNLANKLNTVAVNGAVQGTFQYNDQGARVRKYTGANSTHYLVDANNLTGYSQVLEEMAEIGGTPSVSYLLGDDVLAQSTGNTSAYLLYDGHGSTRQLITGTDISSRYNYDAYGVLLPTSSLPESSLLYCGEQYDSTLEQYYLRARYYDPSNGLFNSRDSFAGNTWDPQSLHKYAYCHGDPINGIDPSGNITLTQVAVTIGIIVVVGAILGLGFRQWSLGPVPTTTNPQVPSSFAGVNTLYHSAYISGSSWKKEDFFKYMTSFQALPGDVIVADQGMTGTDQIVTFTLTGFLPSKGQRPFKVKTVRYDENSMLCVVVTLDGHPLSGWRAWQVSEKNGKVFMETWSVDEPANYREAYKFEPHWYLPGDGGSMEQRKTWQGMIENIATTSGGSLEWDSDPLGNMSGPGNHQQLWDRMGVSPDGK